MKVTITRISKKEKVSAKGKPFTSLGLQTQEHGDKWLSGFDGKETRNWKIGDTVEIEVEQNGEYLNFTVPKLPQGYNLVNEDIVFIKITLGRIVAKLEAIEEVLEMKPKPDSYPKFTGEPNFDVKKVETPF